MQKLKDNHARELNRTNEQHQQEVSDLKRLLDKAYRWFPSFKRFLNMERECLDCGFNMEQTDRSAQRDALPCKEWFKEQFRLGQETHKGLRYMGLRGSTPSEVCLYKPA